MILTGRGHCNSVLEDAEYERIQGDRISAYRLRTWPKALRAL